MIFDPLSNTVIGSMGWIDKAGIWIFDPKNEVEKTVFVEGARYLSFRAGEQGLFRPVHHGSAEQIISIRRLAEPSIELSRVEIVNAKPVFNGDIETWRDVDPIAIINAPDKQRLVMIDAFAGEVRDLDLSWYYGGSYDLGYQGLVDSMSLGTERVIVSVQRSSTLIVIDTESNARVGTISLADRSGNPRLKGRTLNDFLASDYDTLCRVDIRSLLLCDHARLQDENVGNTRQFIGEFDYAWETCVVARPFSGDVVCVDPSSFDILGKRTIAGQPLQVCLISKDRFVTRDWKSGAVTLSGF